MLISPSSLRLARSAVQKVIPITSFFATTATKDSTSTVSLLLFDKSPTLNSTAIDA